MPGICDRKIPTRVTFEISSLVGAGYFRGSFCFFLSISREKKERGIAG